MKRLAWTAGSGLSVIARSVATKQSISRLGTSGDMDCFAALAMTEEIVAFMKVCGNANQIVG